MPRDRQNGEVDEGLALLIDKLCRTRSLSLGEYERLVTQRTPGAARELASRADAVRRQVYGTKVFTRGLIEVSSFCKNDCLYCGIRRSNATARRYRLSADEIVKCANTGYDLGFRTFVLQGGEDPFFADDVLCGIIGQIRAAHPDCAVTLSFGERSRKSYERLHEAGILGEKTITAHNVHLKPRHFGILRETGVTAAHNVQSNTNTAVGICPVVPLMDAGVHVALGGDGYTYDLFTELGFASIQQHIGQNDCSVFSGKQILDMAFTNNQRLAKRIFGYEVGVLRPGAAADFLILDYDPPTPLHAGNVLSHMTSGFSGHVDTVVCDGETVVERHHCTRVDEKGIFAGCRAEAQRLWDSLAAQ